jgi:hypothetical protein
VSKPAAAGPQLLETISADTLRTLPQELIDTLREKAKGLSLEETLAFPLQ